VEYQIFHLDEPELRGGFAALAKKGTIRFTSYQTSEKE
jgi:hypothetical protein